MTDYASSVAAAEPSWTWWMTTAAAAAMRMRDLRERHGGGDDDGVLGRSYGGSYGDADDDDGFAGPDRKRQRCSVKKEYWTSGAESRDWDEDGPRGHDTATVGPLDLSVKATVTTASTAAVAAVDGAGRKDRHTATTPVKRSTTVANGRSSKKSTGKTTGSSGGGGGTTAAAVKAATRKLLPQLLLDNGRVDRSSPVSGTIIVPDPQSTSGPTSPPSPYTVAAECADRQQDDDDYDGGDIDPEFNVVVATDEARRRLESIPNALGPYRCRLCSVRYVDAFALARHRCRCIVHVRYRCPECDKVFQCPANLASHRRWHGTGTKSSGGAVNGNTNNNNNNNNKNNNNNNNKGTAENGDSGGGGGSRQFDRTETATDDDHRSDEKVEVGGGVETIATTPPATSAAAPAVTINVTGFKKNILQRAVQAAAAAAAKHESVGVNKNVS